MIDKVLNMFGAQFFLGLFEAKNPERSHLIFLRVWIFRLGDRPYFASQCTFDKGFECRFTANGKHLGLHEQVIGKVERCFHMGYSMVLRQHVKLPGF